MREGHVREVRHNLSGLVYLVQWSDTRHESVLPHRPDVMINHRRSDGTEQATAEETPWLSGLGHPLEWCHPRDLERRHQDAHGRLAERPEEIVVGLGLV